jgi:hypothetical protein
MSEENPMTLVGIFVGLISLVGGVGSLVVYQRQSEIGIDMLLIGLGGVCVVSGYFTLSRENRAHINVLFVKLGIVKEKLVSCVDCSSYVGQYDVSIRYWDGRPVIYQEPRFSEGICMDRGLLIHDGFHQRRCIYFQQRRTQPARAR